MCLQRHQQMKRQQLIMLEHNQTSPCIGRHNYLQEQQVNQKKENQYLQANMRSSTLVSILVSLCTVQSGHAWSTPTTGSSNNQVSRKSVLQTLVQGSVATAATSLLVQQPAWAVTTGEKLASGVTVEVVKAGNGAKPDVGELVAIRFAAYADGRKIDDIFDTPEPYYTRMGSGGLLKGVETTLPLMVLGDRWKLTIPSALAFGPKGRPASAGKPRIPGGAEVVFDVEITGLPGKEPELIDLIGDD